MHTDEEQICSRGSLDHCPTESARKRHVERCVDDLNSFLERRLHGKYNGLTAETLRKFLFHCHDDEFLLKISSKVCTDI